MKKQSNLGRLLSYAGSRKILVSFRGSLPPVSAHSARAVLSTHMADTQGSDRGRAEFPAKRLHITHYGWMAVAVCRRRRFGVYNRAYVLAHGGVPHSNEHAHRNDRAYLEASAPALSSSSEAASCAARYPRNDRRDRGAYLAHQLPDKAKAIANIVGMLALLAVFDWRLGL